jgi:hypothetical protein
LAGGQQFLVKGFRDGEWLNLTTTAANQAQVYMPTFGNFETQWQWYVVVIDSGGNEISPTSAKLNFGVSLSSGGGGNSGGGNSGGGDSGGGDSGPSKP